MFIFQIDPSKALIAKNDKGISQTVEHPESVLLDSLSGTAEAEGIGGIRPPSNPLLEKITNLTNEYIEYAHNHQNDFNTDDTPDRFQPIMKAPPWETSNELFDALSQYIVVPAVSEKIQNVKDFFYSIMKNTPQDPNSDGKQDVNDVLSIYGLGQGEINQRPMELDGSAIKQRHKGDINCDGNINNDDLVALKDALKTGDLNGDGQLNEVDQQFLQNIIDGKPNIEPLVLRSNIQPQVYRPNRGNGDMNHDGKVNEEDLKIFEKIMNAGDMDSDKDVDQTDVGLLAKQVDGIRPPKDNTLKIIERLSKALLEDPYNHLIEVSKLGKALAKYTNTEYDLGKADRLVSFFLREKSDLNSDGQIDYQDVVAFWNGLDNKPRPLDAPVRPLGDVGVLNQLQAPSDDMLRPTNPLQSSLRSVIDSIIKNEGDFSKVDFSDLVKGLIETGIHGDDNKTIMLQEFFKQIAFPPSGINRPKPPLNIEGLKNIKLEDVIKFWSDPKIEYPV